MNFSETVKVVAAVIQRQDNILIALRPDHLHEGGKWEFPGGKQERAESAEAALCRELKEELGITPTSYRRLIAVNHQYPEKHVSLDVWLVTEFLGEPEGKEGQRVEWVDKAQLSSYTFPAANYPIIKAVHLPACCVITSPETQVSQIADRSFQDEILIVRFPSLSAADYSSVASKVVEYRQKGQKVMLTSQMSEVQALGADGLHMNSRRLMATDHLEARSDQWLSAACHNQEELEKAVALGLDFVLLSPVRPTTTHPQADPLGWTQFARLVRGCNLPVFALGGVKPGDLQQAWRSGAQGVAGIGAFWS